MKKILGILILVFAILVAPYHAFASTFTLTDAQIERAKTVEGFSFYIFENHSYALPYDFDFDGFLDMLIEFDMRMEEPPADLESIVVDNLEEMESLLIDFENMRFIPVENEDVIIEAEPFSTERRRVEAYQTWSVDGSFLGVANPRVTLFVDHTQEFVGVLPRITSINHYSWRVSGFVIGISVANSIASASLRAANNGTIDASGNIAINQHFMINALPVVRTANYRGSFSFDLANRYSNVQFAYLR